MLFDANGFKFAASTSGSGGVMLAFSIVTFVGSTLAMISVSSQIQYGGIYIVIGIRHCDIQRTSFKLDSLTWRFHSILGSGRVIMVYHCLYV